MTEALRQLSGGQTRAVPARFTRTPLRGALSGMLTTAVVQSSSAATVTAVGFVGAGLIGFPQAVGVIIDANLGTTITGWMVVLLGFKLKLRLATLPVLLTGALQRVRARGTAARVGAVLVGLGLLFLGLEMMTQALRGFSGFPTPATLPPDTWPGRGLLVAIGIAATLVTQSSSAGVATTLALLGAGSISFT
jgi:phosphate:Na+ symporter